MALCWSISTPSSFDWLLKSKDGDLNYDAISSLLVWRCMASANVQSSLHTFFLNEWVGELQVTFKGKGELTRANKITYACLPRRILQFMLVRYHQTN